MPDAGLHPPPREFVRPDAPAPRAVASTGGLSSPVTAVPAPRLIAVSAALLPLLLGMAVALPELAPASYLVLVALLLVASLDAGRGRRGLGRLRAGIEGPHRLTRGRRAHLALRLEHLPPATHAIRVGIAWPASRITADDVLDLALPADASHVRVEWPCQARQRGPVVLDRCHVERRSPWELWDMRASPRLDTCLRVYPDLSGERRRLAALFLPHAASGWRQERMLGQGREFEQLREYVAGDSWEDIHWKATAKRGRPVTKLFQLERTQEVYVILDYSRLAARSVDNAENLHEGTSCELEYRLNAALMLGLAAQRQGDRFGFVAFGSRTTVFLRAASGAAHFQRCQDALHALTPESASSNLAELVSTLRQRLRRRALLVFLTALDDPLVAEEFERGVRLLARQHLVLVHQVATPGLEPLLHGGIAADLPTIARQFARHFQWKTLRSLASRLRRLGATFALVQAGDLASATVSRYVQLKRQQRL